VTEEEHPAVDHPDDKDSKLGLICQPTPPYEAGELGGQEFGPRKTLDLAGEAKKRDELTLDARC
jgi:hypothetical protein